MIFFSAHAPAPMRIFVRAALTAAAITSVTQPARAETVIRFSFDWKFEGTQAPFLVAFDKGYFRAEGLDVRFDSGVSAVDSINRLASGTHDMAFGDINILIRFRDQYPRMPIKTVFMIYNNPPYAIVARRSLGVTAPKDLEGRKLGAPAEDSAYAQWPIFAQANNIDQSKVTIMNVGFAVREAMLASGHVDAVTGLSFSSYINVKYINRGVPQNDIVVLLMAHFGVSLYGNGIMVGPTFASENPEAVRGFLRAYLKGLKDAVKDPAAAIDSVLRRNNVATKSLELERLQLALRDNVLTPEVQAKGFGAIDTARLDKAIEQISRAYPFKSGRPKAEDIFDSSFLPAESERRAN